MSRSAPPWRRRDRWSPDEAASELFRRRVELIGQFRRRSDGRGIPPHAQEEIVDDAITAVVMAPRGTLNESHLLGAFWLAVENRCRRYREGRHLTRLGSRQRVELDVEAQRAPVATNPFDAVELLDRLARAADLMAELNGLERRVVAVMANMGVGPASAAQVLDVPLGEARSAARSASAKLDRIAIIYAAGRMCDFRTGALMADAARRADERDASLARAHINACTPCRHAYRRLRREMRRREFQRAAAAAFLPTVPTRAAHIGGLGKIAVWIEQRMSFMPRGTSGRAAEVLGGAGIVKAGAAGMAIVAAGGALTGQALHVLGSPPAQGHHRTHLARRPPPHPLASASALGSGQFTATNPTSGVESAGRHSAPPASTKPPSKSLGYLALGASAASPHDGSPASAPENSRETSARAASVTSSPGESEPATPVNRGTEAPTQSGGGTSLSYLGK
jgi:DNA-directed RNA polymerase specialized sigma24 family protein